MFRQRLQGVFEDGFALAAAEAELALGGLEGGASDADGLEHGGEAGTGGLKRAGHAVAGGEAGIAWLDPGGGAGAGAGQGVPPLGQGGTFHGQFGIAGQAQACGDL
ncbi:MAG TPA: PE family protein, partial [Brevundimonas sp.]|nr:PE family protein [Brevundimonas sp.]